MRKTIDPQLKIGQTYISDIKFDLSSRDEIPQLLIGLQVIHSDPSSRKAVFQAISESLGETIDFHNGRPVKGEGQEKQFQGLEYQINAQGRTGF